VSGLIDRCQLADLLLRSVVEAAKDDTERRACR
jgi:hypothetical protein